MGPVPYLDVAGALSADDGKISVFILNRDLSNPHNVELNWEDKTPGRVLTASVLTGNDLKAVNGFDAPQRVIPQAMDEPTTSGGKTKFEVPARSYTMIQWGA